MVNRENAAAVLRKWFPHASEDEIDGAATSLADLG